MGSCALTKQDVRVSPDMMGDESTASIAEKEKKKQEERRVTTILTYDQIAEVKITDEIDAIDLPFINRRLVIHRNKKVYKMTDGNLCGFNGLRYPTQGLVLDPKNVNSSDGYNYGGTVAKCRVSGALHACVHPRDCWHHAEINQFKGWRVLEAFPVGGYKEDMDVLGAVGLLILREIPRDEFLSEHGTGPTSWQFCNRKLRIQCQYRNGLLHATGSGDNEHSVLIHQPNYDYVLQRQWHKDGKLHRDHDLPANVIYCRGEFYGFGEYMWGRDGVYPRPVLYEWWRDGKRVGKPCESKEEEAEDPAPNCLITWGIKTNKDYYAVSIWKDEKGEITHFRRHRPALIHSVDN